jgi:lipid-A-disaccharide synthase
MADERTPVEGAPEVGDRPLRLFVIAGENSGDIHGANLFRALFRLHPNLRATGLGGPQLEEAGVKLKSNIVEDLAIIGVTAVIANFPRIRRLFLKTMEYLKTHRPDAIILVDYPGFNIRIAERAKKLGIPVIWYISPQIWAWHRSRLYTLARVVDRMLVIFPFEVSLYREENVDVVHVGHPLFDVITVDKTREEVCKAFNFDPDRPLIGIIPGSRRKEVKQFLPIMLEGMRRYHELEPRAQFVIVRASTIEMDMIQNLIDAADLSFEPAVTDKDRYNLRAACDFSWVKSGTSTLEAAILGTPMLIVYRVNYMTWMIGKQIFTIGHIGLPNIIAGDRIVPELLQDEFTPRNLAEKTHHYLNNRDEYERMVSDLNNVRKRLGGPGASEKAARAVLEVCGINPDKTPTTRTRDAT